MVMGASLKLEFNVLMADNVPALAQLCSARYARAAAWNMIWKLLNKDFLGQKAAAVHARLVSSVWTGAILWIRAGA